MANDGRGGRVDRHPAELKQRALALAADYGPGRAARELNLSENTIRSWQQRASQKAHRELARRQLVVPIRKGTPWPERRNQLLGGLTELAEEATAAARLSVSQGRSKSANEFSSVAARAVDKVLLLGGQPTSRSESRSMNVRVDATEMQELQDEIAELERELADG
jgi:transposase-like protein